MADSFNNQPLNVERPQVSREQSAEVSIVHIPGGSNSYIDLAGLPPITLTLKLYHPSDADYLSLEAMVGTAATLVYAQGTWPAVLVSVTMDTRYANGQVESTAKFILT